MGTARGEENWALLSVKIQLCWCFVAWESFLQNSLGSQHYPQGKLLLFEVQGGVYVPDSKPLG